MRIIYDLQGTTFDNAKVYKKYLEYTKEDKPIILEYLKEHYPEWWLEPELYPLPDIITIYITLEEDLVSFDINTELLKD